MPPTSTPEPIPTPDSDAVFDRLIPELLQEWGVPGAAVAVARDGRLVLAKGYGIANIESEEPVEPDSLFRIASISKPITAVAALQLVEEGLLGLDERVFQILDEFEPPNGASIDPRLDEITIRQLLQHSGGWDRDKSYDPMFIAGRIETELGVPKPVTCPDVIRFMLGQPLDFDPGARYTYSNFGYCLLGRVIEEKTGRPYEEYVRERVINPLGISRMRIGGTMNEDRAESEVTYYDYPGQELAYSVMPGTPEMVPWPYGGFYLEDSVGGWIASAIDLVRFATSVDGSRPPRILEPATVEEMVSRPEPPLWADSDYYYGMGWLVRPVNDDANWWHGGSLPGTTSLLVRTHHGFTWAALFNSRPEEWGLFSDEVDDLMWRGFGEVSHWPTQDLFPEYGYAVPAPEDAQSVAMAIPDASLSLSVETELAGYWSSGEGGAAVTLKLMDTELPWSEGVHTISIVCRQDGVIVERCGEELRVTLPAGGGSATSSTMLRAPMGGVSYEFDFGGIEPVTTQFHVPERILGVERDVWECFSDEPDRLDPDTAETPIGEQGYYGDCAGWGIWAGQKWDHDVPVRVWATGLESYIAVLREALRELSPLLNLDFTWVDSEEDATLKAYMGLPASQAVMSGFAAVCAEARGCGSPITVTREGVVRHARLGVWLNRDEWWTEAGLLDSHIRYTTVHEALHALVPMLHREDPGSIMNIHNTLPLGTLSRMDEALLRLHQSHLAQPGMTSEDIEPLIVFREELLDSPPAPEPDGYELMRSAFAALQEADSARFRVRGAWSGSNCEATFGWADLEIADFSEGFAKITRFKDGDTHFFVIGPGDGGGDVEFWSERDGQWEEVGADDVDSDTNWRLDFSIPHAMLASALFFSDADDIVVSRGTDGLIILSAALDDAFIVLPWSGGETLEVEMTLAEDTLKILEYDFKWTFDVPPESPCTSYTTMAVDGEYRVGVQIPDAILGASVNIAASRDAFDADP